MPSGKGKSVGRLSFSMDGVLRRTVRAARRVDDLEWQALRQAQMRDREELPTMEAMLNYCLKLGIETYLAGQPDEEADPR
jgi:hypothetical protein